MDLQNIQDQLNTEFAKPSVKYIFWFDDKAEYENEVSELDLGRTKLHVLTGDNWLYSKWLFAESDPESKYLIYAPFARPSDGENPLADMYYYSMPYYTDRVSQMSQEIGIETKFKEHLAKYGNFWKNKNRIEKFKDLVIDHYTPETIDIGLMAVLTDVKTPNFEEIVKQMLLSDKTEDYLQALETNGLKDRYWELCEKYFGYKFENAGMDDLTVCIIMTYTANSMKGKLPDTWDGYLLKRRNDAVVLVRNIMDNILYKDRYDTIAEKIDKELRVSGRISEEITKGNIDLTDIVECDSFSGIDNIIIKWAIEKLSEELIDSSIGDLSIEDIANLRMGKAFHYAEKYSPQYKVIKNAYKIMKFIDLMDFATDTEVMINNYRNEKYLVDSYYCWFYYAFDQIEDADPFLPLQERVENIYSRLTA